MTNNEITVMAQQSYYSQFSAFFATNPSNKFLIAIDNVYMEFETFDAATKIWDTIGSIEESPFGSAVMIRPNQIAQNIFGKIATEAIQDNLIRVNSDYVAKHKARAFKNVQIANKKACDSSKLMSRLITHKRWKEWERKFC